jgi:hypothetical protein
MVLGTNNAFTNWLTEWIATLREAEKTAPRTRAEDAGQLEQPPRSNVEAGDTRSDKAA